MESVLITTRKHDVVFHRNGQIDLGKRIVHELDLHAGDIIDILYGDREHYLYCKRRHTDITGTHHAQCHPAHRGRALRVFSVQLTNHVFSIFNTPQQQTIRLATGALTKTDSGQALPLILKAL